MGHFNNLTPAETERLDMLAEEAAEVIVAVSKIKRHGYASYNPDDEEAGTNRQQLHQEFADFRAVWEMMCAAGDVTDPCKATIDRAWVKKFTYSHHQEPPSNA
jgi:hypothetical protein